MKKLLHERLRELSSEDTIVALVAGHGSIPLRPSDARYLADEIERYYIPRPRFEDGEPVTWSSSELEWIDTDDYSPQTPWRITAISNNGVPLATSGNKIVSRAAMTDDGFVKRPSPKSLDHEGMEIKKDETVWCIDTGTKLKVISIDIKDGTVLCDNDFIYDPDALTHKEPDSLQKIHRDMMEHFENWDSDPNEWVEVADRLSALIEKAEQENG